MLSTYQAALFTVPENPVMRAALGAQVMPSAGATTGPLKKSGMGCACGIKPFGMGLVNDEGLRLYGDWYGSQQHGGMRLNGDPLPGLGSYWRVPKGMGDIGTLFSNLASGNFSAALTGNDLSDSIPNFVVIFGVWWLISTVTGQVGSKVDRVKKRYKAARRAPRGLKFSSANDAT